jgi:hypothetical protein
MTSTRRPNASVASAIDSSGSRRIGREMQYETSAGSSIAGTSVASGDQPKRVHSTAVV